MSERVKVLAKTTDSKNTNSILKKQKINSSQYKSTPINYVLHLQQTIGNQEVQRSFKYGVIQAKYKIEKFGDKYEQEADKIADQVVRSPDSVCPGCGEEKKKEEELIQPKPISYQITSLVQCQVEDEEKKKREEETVQTKEINLEGLGIAANIESSINNLKGKGKPLPITTGSYFEPRFGYDFSGVKIHTGSKESEATRSINAQAFTIGSDIAFGSGNYSPETESGKSLLTHELSHRVQLTNKTSIIMPKAYVWPGVARGRETTKKEEKKELSEEEKKRLAEILKKVDEMISVARKAGYKYAADNLEYWRSKKGGIKKMPASAFKDQEFIIKWLRGKPRKKFLIGAEKRLKSGELVSGGRVNMYWIDSLMAPKENELFYALGGFTIRSDVIVKAEEFPEEWGGGYLVSFEKWTCKATDDYNWDKLKYTIIPLYGKVSDDDLRLLEKAGYGKSFKIESEPWAVTDSKCLQKVSISS